MNHTFDGVSVAILAGGLGTRLRSVVPDRPKVLASVNGRPFLGYLLHQLAEAGAREVSLLVGFAAEQVRTTFGDHHGSLRLNYSRELTPLGTGGAIRLALPQLAGERVLLLNGDSFCDVNLDALRTSHEHLTQGATLTLTHVPDAGRYGRVGLDSRGWITRFEEKNPAAGAGLINAGIYLFNRQLLQQIPENQSVSLERDCLPQWAESGCLWGFQSGGKFIDIGTPDSYHEAAHFFAKCA